MPWTSCLGRSSVPVLLYHQIGQLGSGGVARQDFIAQMRWLAEAGVHSLTPADLARVLTGEPLDRPAVLITFDDGFRDLYTSIGPLLAELDFSATVFLINSRIRPENEPGQEGEIVSDKAHLGFVLDKDRSPWLSDKEIRELMDSGVLDIGSHSFSHEQGPVSPPTLAQVPDHWSYARYTRPMRDNPGEKACLLKPELAQPLYLAEEGGHESQAQYRARVLENLCASKADLEARFGVPVTSLAWPWGEFSATAMDAAREAGLNLLFTLERGPVCAGTDPARLPRLEVRSRKGMGWFTNRIFLYSRALTARLYSAMRV